MLGESVCRSEAGLEWLKSLFWTIGGVAKLFGLVYEHFFKKMALLLLGTAAWGSQERFEWLIGLSQTIDGAAKLFKLEHEPYCDIFVAPDEC